MPGVGDTCWGAQKGDGWPQGAFLRCPEWGLPRGAFLGCHKKKGMTLCEPFQDTQGRGQWGDAGWRELAPSSSAGGAWVRDTLLGDMGEAPVGVSLGYRITPRVPF